ncbi:DNA polymerase III subunit beta [Patescibacteria group bacterium]|nr:DNA polymerase III subunit beta [Patescibacteria group bacterium]MCG2696186.1 DNA polymerase III subunit beta [Candidatus Portnoybacteria bacterium]
MKIICLQENLKNGLNIVQNITGKNLTLPILNNILLSADQKQLKLSTTNLEMAITSHILCKIEKEGSITIPAKLLVNFINNLPNKKIEINIKNNIANLKCDNYKSIIKGLDAKDFPIIPKIKSEPILEIDSFEFKNALEQVINFVSISDIRPEISGILFDLSNEKRIKFVATDSFRLGEKILNIKSGKTKKDDVKSIIIPYKTVQELIRIISNQENNTLKISIENNQILFSLPETQIISRLIEGNYPNYQQLISKQFDTTVVIKREELIKAVKIGSFFSSRINDIRFKVDCKKSLIEVFSQDIELGENSSEIEVETKGKDLEIIFNHKYLLDGLNNINAEKIVISFNGEISPGIIRPEGKEDFTYIIMPIKL